jgi:hypothetical protein
MQKPCDYIISVGCLKVKALPFKGHRSVRGVTFSGDRVASTLVVCKQNEKQKDYASSGAICSYVNMVSLSTVTYGRLMQKTMAIHSPVTRKEGTEGSGCTRSKHRR